MAKYLELNQIQELIDIKNRIHPLRETAFIDYGIDLLDNDTLSSLSIWEIVSKYDSLYNINFSRNGEDAKSDLIIEQKCSNVLPSKNGKVRLTSFQFHAMGKLDYPRFIFAVRRKDTLELVRLYDISNPDSVKLIIDNLLLQREAWLERGKLDPVKNMKRDVITLSEKMLKSIISGVTVEHTADCEIYRDMGK